MRAQIQRVGSVHPNSYSIYELAKRMEGRNVTVNWAVPGPVAGP